MRVLIIGQLPKEIGGNYTTGMGNVIYALSSYTYNGESYIIYGANICHRKAVLASKNGILYEGYRYNLLLTITDIIIHPFTTIKQSRFFKKNTTLSPVRGLFYKYNFIRLLKRYEPDLVHIHSMDYAAPLFFANKKHIPIISTIHGVFFNNSTQEKSCMSCVNFVDYYTGLTEFDYERLISLLGIEESKITVIPNGVNTSSFYYSKIDRYFIRNQYAVGDRTVFLTIGSLQKRKGQLDFLKLLSESSMKYQYWMIGKGEDYQAIMNYIESHNMEENVKVIGYVNNNELYRYYSAADVYAHVSYAEGQALSEIEAVSTGLPVLVNFPISKTVVGDIKNKELYHIISMEEGVNFEELEIWCKIPRYRMHTNIFDWSYISNEYHKLYNKIFSKEVAARSKEMINYYSKL